MRAIRLAAAHRAAFSTTFACCVKGLIGAARPYQQIREQMNGSRVRTRQLLERYNDLLKEYNELVTRWNRYVGFFAGGHAIGRPLRAIQAYQAQVRKVAQGRPYSPRDCSRNRSVVADSSDHRRPPSDWPAPPASEPQQDRCETYGGSARPFGRSPMISRSRRFEPSFAGKMALIGRPRVIIISKRSPKSPPSDLFARPLEPVGSAGP
jgi:hypothetical protein